MNLIDRLSNKMLQNQFKSTSLGIRQKLVEIQMNSQSTQNLPKEESYGNNTKVYGFDSENSKIKGLKVRNAEYLAEKLELEREKHSLERQLNILI